MLVEGQFVDVFVTHVESTGKTILVWTQTDHDEGNQLETLMNDVENKASTLSAISIDGIEKGDVCLALYQEDKKWYRAQVEKVDKPNARVKVCFYDYGNTENIRVEDLRKAEQRYCELAPQAASFQVANFEPSNGEEWLPEEMALVRDRLQYNEFTGQVMQDRSIGNPPLLHMFDGIGSKSTIEDKLVEEGVGRICAIGSKAVSVPMTVLKPGESYHVYLSYFNSPVDFWLQVAENSSVLDDLNGKIESVKDSGLQPLPPNDIKAGTVCIAYASEYDAYYRAVVSNVRKSEGKCLVTYVDYGNNEEKKFDELFGIHPSILELSSQGIPCCLFGAKIEPDDLERYMSSESLHARVVKISNSGTHVVEFSDGGFEETIAVVLPQGIGAKPKIKAATKHFKPVQFNVGSIVPVCISHVEDTGMFYCQLMENRWKIDGLMVDLQTFYSASGCSASSPKKGDAVVVRNGKEDVYHRAEVISASSNEVHVKLVDLGDTECVPTSKVFVIDERHVEMPSQAVCCQLDGSETLPPSAVAAFLKTYESRKSLMAKIVLKTPKYCDVELVDTNSDDQDVGLISLLKENSSSQTKTSNQSGDNYTQPLIEEGMWEDVIISYVDTPDDFYCKLVSSEDEFNSMSEQMEAYCNNLRPGQGRLIPATVGASCIAKDEDQEWYRAVITEIRTDGIAEVRFVDFGNPGEVPVGDIIAMKSNFMQLPIQTVRCGLQGVHCKGSSEWSDVEIERFSSVQNNNQLVLFVSKDSHQGRYLVDMHGPYTDDSVVSINEVFGTQYGELSRSYQSHKPPPSHPAPASTVPVGSETTKVSSVGASSSKSNTSSFRPSASSFSNNHLTSRLGETIGSDRSRSNGVPHQIFDSKPMSKSWARWEGKLQKSMSVSVVEIQPGDGVYVSFGVSPTKFWCQPAVSSELLSTMGQKLNSEYSSLSNKQLEIPSPSVGQMCCALYTEDYSWYRAKVLKISGRNAQVFFVDYGNLETVAVSTLKELKEDYTKLPCQAVECSLAKVAPRSGHWSDAACDRFSKLCADKELQVQSIEREGDAHHLELGEVGRRGTNIGLALVQMGHALMASGPTRERSGSQDSSNSVPPSTARFDRVRLTPGEPADVNVVYVVDPHNFFCQLTRNCTPLGDLMHTIARDLSRHDVAIKRIVRPRIGQICGAKYDPENKWYRAEVVATEGSQVKVNFVDYGDEQWIGTEGLKTLKRQHIELPAQAVQCRLDNIAPASGGHWSKDAIAIFEELVYDKNLVAQVLTEGNGVYTIRLIVPGIGRRPDYSVADKMMEMRIGKPIEALRQLRGRAVSETVPALTRSQEEEFVELHSIRLNDGQSYQMILTWVENPKEFWCQRAESSDRMSALDEEIYEAYQSLRIKDEQLRNPAVGQYCVTARSSDGSWYRACIMRQQGTNYLVRYVDYGDTDTVSASKLKKLMDRFSNIPCQAFRCSLKGVEPGSDGEWTPAAVSVFQELLSQTVSLTICEKTGDKYLVLMQDENGVDVAEKVNSLGIQKLRGQSQSREPQSSAAPVYQLETELSSVRIGQTLSVQVVHVHSHMSFFCQLRSRIMARDEMMDKLDAYCQSLSRDEGVVRHLEPGLFCVARFSEDGGWYRACIIDQVGRTEYLAHYIDYGNKEAVHINDMKGLPPQGTRLPAQAIECTLSGEQQQTRNAEATQKLMALTDGKNLKAKVIAISDRKLQVELLDENSGKSINREVANLFRSEREQSGQRRAMPIAPKKQTFAKRDIPTKKPVAVYASHVDSPVMFFLQVASEEDQLTELATELNNEYCAVDPSQFGLKNAGLGDACVARFSEDGSWYRATITELKRGKATVRFLDYGNTDQSNAAELKEVFDKYLTTPPFAVQCTLSVEEDVGPEVIAKLEELLMAEDGEIKAEFLDSKVTPVPTIVTVNGKDVVGTLGLSIKQPSYKRTEVSTGVKVKVTPTSIESPSAVYLQVSAVEDEVQMLVDTVNEHYSALSKDDMEVFDPVEGMACVAQFSEDNSWYRATVESITENQATVTFVDFGNSDVVPINSIKVVRKRFLEAAPYAIKCKLRSLTEPAGGWSDELCADLEAKLVEEDVMIAAEFHSKTVPVEVDLFINSRNLVDILQLDKYKAEEHALETAVEKEELQPTYPAQVKPDGDVKAHISSINCPSDFFVQLLSNENEFVSYDAKLQDDYASFENLNRADCVLESTVEDDNVETKTEETVAGQQQDVAEEREHLNESVDQGSKEYDSAYEGEEQLEFQEETDKQPDQEENTTRAVEVDKQEDLFCVELETEGNDGVSQSQPKQVSMKNVTSENLEDESAKYAAPDAPDKSEHLEESAAYAAPDAPDEKYMSVTSENLGEESASYAAPDEPDKSGHLDDQKGSVASEGEGMSEGKEEVVDRDDGDEEDCQKADDSDNKDQRNPETKENTSEDEKDKETEVTAVEEKRVETADIDEAVTVNEDVNAEAADQMVAVNEEKEAVVEKEQDNLLDTEDTMDVRGDREEAGVLTETELDVAGNEEAAAALTVMEDTRINMDIDQADIKVGILCVVKCPDDAKWYRAVVTDVEDRDVIVCCIDYGRMISVGFSSLKKVSEDHLSRPPFAFHCQLDGIKDPEHGWTTENTELFKSAADGADLQVSFVSDSEPFIVKITVDEENILGRLPVEWSCHVESEIEESSSQCPTAETMDEGEAGSGVDETSENIGAEKSSSSLECYPTQNLYEGQILDVYASEVESASLFYLQLASQEDDLTNLAEEVNEYYSTNVDVKPLTGAKVNMPCVAQFTDEDGTAAWYRAKIIGLEETSAKVLFIDYGNSERVSVSELKEVAEKYIGIAPYAMCCKLNSDVNEGTCERFGELLLEAEELTAEVVDVSDPTIVKLLVAGENVVSWLDDERYSDETSENLEGDSAKYAAPDGPDKSEHLEESAAYAAPNAPDEKYMSVTSENLGEESASYAAPDEKYTFVTREHLGEKPASYAAPDETDDVCEEGDNEKSPAPECGTTIEDALVTHPSPDSGVGFPLGVEVDEVNEVEGKVTENKDDEDSREEIPVKKFNQIDGDNNSSKELDPLQEPCPEDAIIKPLSLPALTQTPVYVSHCESPSNFYIQLADTYQLDQLNELMQRVYTDEEDNHRFQGKPKSGMLCAVFSKDDHLWYRAKILDIIEDSILVRYTDFGNIETITDRIKPLQTRFLETPALAVQCTLSDLMPLSCENNWSQECLETFEAETGMQRELLAEIQTDTSFPGPQGDVDVLRLKLYAEETSIADVLVNAGLAAYSTECAVHKFRNPHFDGGNIVPVHVTSVLSPENFMCQLAEPSVTELPLLMDKIHDYCTDKSDILNPPKLVVGMACLAMYSKDSDWYRAEITSIKGSEIDVLFVDYGNSDTIDISKIKAIPVELLSLPRLVVPGQLYGVESIGMTWDETSNARFEELCECENSELTAKVMDLQTSSKESSAPTVTVQLMDKDGQFNISDMLVDGGYAKRLDGMSSTPTFGYSMSFLEDSQGEADPLISVRYLQGQSPSNFICQLADSKDKLAALMKDINDTITKEEGPLPVKNCQVGQMCLAPEDDTWYRAVITAIDHETPEVKFVDYGRRSMVSQSVLRPISVPHQKLPEQAIACQLAGIEAEAWTAEATAEFEEMCSGKDLTLKIVGELGEEELTLVYLSDKSDTSGQSINAHLVSKGYAWWSTLNETVEKADPEEFEHNQEEHEDSFLEVSLVRSSSFGSLNRSVSESEQEPESIKYRSITLEEGEICNMYVVEAIDPDNIICQPEESSSELSALMKHLENAYKDSEGLHVLDVHPGQPCLVHSLKDEKWYRCRVIRKEDDDMIEVYHVDYGNKEVVSLSRLRILVPDEKLVSLPAQAVHCVLSGVSPFEDTWHEDAGDFLRSTLCGTSESVEVSVGSIEDDNRVVVQISTSEKENISELLIKNQLAKIGTPGVYESSNERYIYSRRVLNTEEEVDILLTHVVDPSQFWCQVESPKFEELSRKMTEFYNSRRLCVVNEPHEGTACAVQNLTTKCWHRAQIESVYQSTASVRLVDTGVVETVPVSQLYPLRRQFMENPPFALPCSLHEAQPRIGGEWTDPACGALTNLLQNAMTMNIMTLQDSETASNTVVLKLKASNTSVLQLLVDGKHAKEPKETDTVSDCPAGN